MNTRAQVRLLPDGRRLHLHDGPIDIVLEAYAISESEVRAAYDAAADRFLTVLDELCAELPLLRTQTRPGSRGPRGIIARRMFAAVIPFAGEQFITPMAAVAGAVAEELLNAMTNAAILSRAYVNDGGDIALHLSPGESFTIAMIDRPDRPSLFGTMKLESSQPVRGIATSGWRGRSFSRGIADAVTVLANSAATADAAVTIVANAVDLPGHTAIQRTSARELSPDTDLGEILVTTKVAGLTNSEIAQALSHGAECAEHLCAQGLLHAAALHLQGTTRIVMADRSTLPAPHRESSVAYA
ncbi:MAG TPA: UPF0280 family protein [Terriglobales bacterium]|nr:UPF0280 family protein [Terriglobales bacterium]